MDMHIDNFEVVRILDAKKSQLEGDTWRAVCSLMKYIIFPTKDVVFSINQSINHKKP